LWRELSARVDLPPLPVRATAIFIAGGIRTRIR
jgi:hypothetical protein